MNVEYPVENEDVEVSVATPFRSYDLIDVDFEKPRFNGFGPVIKPVWHLPLDNTRFGISALMKYAHDKTSEFPPTIRAIQPTRGYSMILF